MSSGGAEKGKISRPAGGASPRRLQKLRPAERGVALLLVLWLLALLSVMALSFSGTARTQAYIARNLQDNTQARWLADAGVRLAVRRLWLAQTAEEGVEEPPDESNRFCRFGPGRLAVLVQNVSGLIDLNVASPDTLARLFAAAGLEEADALRLAAAVADFRDTNDRKRPDGAEAEDYAAAGLLHGPKNGAFRAVEELEQVLGMQPDLLERVRTSVTVHSKKPTPDLRLAPPLVRRAFGLAPEQEEAQTALDGNGGTFRITVTARTDTGAWFVRDAVVFVRGKPWPEYRVLSWGRAPGRNTTLRDARDLPPC